MSRSALSGISQVIKANTTEKSIDALRAEGKKHVRVVSSDKVMAIIQAIVDDTISSEVGEITKRDRDRIVSDTQDRFSKVLRMQQDLEQDVDDLRGSLQTAELERDRLRNEKTFLESQLETARQADGADDAVARMARDMARMRDAVERTARETPVIDEASIARMVEKIAARETQSARRLEAGLEDLRARLDTVGKEAATTRDAALEKLVQRVSARQTEAETQLAARLERELRTVAERLAALHETTGRAPAAEDAVARLRADFDAIEKRIHGFEKSSADSAERVAKTVLARLEQRDAAEGDRRGAGAAAEAAQVTESLRRAQRASDEARETILREVASLRESVRDAISRPMGVKDDQVRDLEQRVGASAAEASGAVARAVSRIDERVASLDGSLKAMRGELAASSSETTEALAQTVERIAERMASLDGSLQAVRGDVTGSTSEATGAVEQAVERIEQRMSALDASLQSVRGDVTGSTSEATGAVAQAVSRIEERLSAFDGSLRAMRDEVGGLADRTPVDDATAAEAESSARLDGALSELRGELASLRAMAAREAEAAGGQAAAIRELRDEVIVAVDRAAASGAAASQADAAARVDDALAGLRAELTALTARGAEAAERQDAAIRSLREQVTMSAAVQSGSLESTFKGALEQALDKITRTMERATARPIEMTGEATDVLLAKMFDVPDGQMTSNLDQLDVEERRSTAKIGKSVGRLKEMSGGSKSAKK